MEDYRNRPGRDLDFSKSLSKWGTDGFESAVYEDLEGKVWKLPLEDLCESGGWPDTADEVDFTIGDVQERPKEIVVSADVWFKESIPASCRDINWTEDRHGNLRVEIDKQTGRADVTAERDEMRRNLENY